MKINIQLNLYATLRVYTPENSDNYPIARGITVKMLLESLNVPLDQVKLIFVDSKKVDMDKTLQGGERVGVFPPVGGG